MDLLRLPQRSPGVHRAEKPAHGQLPACTSLMVWDGVSWVRSQPLSRAAARLGTGWERSSRAPPAQQAALPLELHAAALWPSWFFQRCIQGAKSDLKGRELARSWLRTGAVKAAPGTGHCGQAQPRSQGPKPALCRTAPHSRSCCCFFIDLCLQTAWQRHPAPALPTSFVLHHQILTNQPRGLG